MERGKTSSGGRGAKSKAPQHPQDIFALGTKSTVVVSRSGDVDKRSVHKPGGSGSGSAGGSAERKREASAVGSTSGAASGAKRARIGSPAESVPGPSSASLEVEPVDLVPSVLHALDTHNSDKLLGLLTGATRLLRGQRTRTEPALCMALLYLAKLRPNMFAHETVATAVCAVLRRDPAAAYKGKAGPQPAAAAVAAALLYAAHRDHAAWPEIPLRAYLDDALNDRTWLDSAWCRPLVENLATAFGTRAPPSHLSPPETTAPLPTPPVTTVAGTGSPVGAGSPLRIATDDDVDDGDLEYSVFPRYSSGREAAEALVLEAIKEQLQRRAAPDAIGKGFLKLLSATCGFPEIRVIAASRLEAWLHSGKLSRAAQELLAYVCCNLETSARDHEVLAQLARMRLKTKPLLGAYIACLREAVADGGALLRPVVTHTVYNELSNVRSPNNMAVLAALMHAQPQAVPHAMADTYHELLLRPEEYLRPLRALTRECVRAAAARPDAAAAAASALVPLARALADRPPHEPAAAAAEVRERAFAAIADLLCLCSLLSASQARHLPDYKQQVCCIQGAAAGWLLDSAAQAYRPSRHDYQHALHKVLFLEPAETYSKADNWPPESERAALHRLCCEVPLPQNTLLRLIFIGLSKELPVGPGEAFELVEQAVRRACALPPDDDPLPVDKLELPEYIFQLCQYHHPDNITLPLGYTAPSLAITSLYWRAWLVLVMLAAHNPHSFAEHVYHKYPTLKALIEMCITNEFNPESVGVVGGADGEAERAAILQLETHLAAASNAKLPITEHTSRLLSQLTMLDPTGPARRPPSAVCEALQQLSGALRLGRLLCRQPALLLDVVDRHGTRRAMPWLHRLLQQSQLELSVLPVQCLCEFLAAGGAGEAGGKAPELAAHLRRTLHDSEEGARAVLHYYMQRLAHHHASVRAHANRGLKLVLSPGGNNEAAELERSSRVQPEEWLELLTETRQWAAVCEEALSRVRAACLVECSPRALAAYVVWLAQRVATGERAQLADIALDLSQVLMERASVVSSALPPPEQRDTPIVYPSGDGGSGEMVLDPQRTLHALTSILYTYVREVRTTGGAEEVGEPSATVAGAERVELQWPDGRQCSMHVLVAHAAVKLLCYGPSAYDAGGEMYAWLCAAWVGRSAPTAFVLGSSGAEEAQLLPDWLRLHLVRSARTPLVEAGLRGLSAHKLALFIQTFGMPVSSISALLAALDACPAGAVLRLAVERPYMAQLLRVQRARGATGGHAFAATLRLSEPHYPPDETLFAPRPLPPETASIWEPGVVAPADDRLCIDRVEALLESAFFGGRNFSLPLDGALARLQAAVAEEACGVGTGPYAQRAITYLVSNAAEPERLWRALASRPSYAVPLLRCLTATSGSSRRALARTCEALLAMGVGGAPLASALRRAAAPARGEASTSSPVCSESTNIPTNRENLVAALEGSTARSLEPVGARLIGTLHPPLVLEAVSRALERSQAGAYETAVKREDGASAPHVLARAGRGAGLLVDWLSELQPDTLGGPTAAAPHAQMRLMFRAGGAPWRPQLVTLLAHRGSWRALHACLTTLLQPETPGEWSAAAVLELAAALARSPRLSRPAPQLDALRLTHAQLSMLVSYAMEEGRGAPPGEPMRRRVEARLPLLLHCCADDAALLCVALTALRAARAPDDVAPRLLLLLLYMKVPKILKLLRESTGRDDDSRTPLPPRVEDAVAARAPCTTDRASHALLTALAADHQLPAKENAKRGWRIECGLRALWARHWRAADRALPLLAALVQGLPPRAPALVHLLAAVELVPDHALFADTNKAQMRAILECFLYVAREQNSGGSSLVHRTAALVRRYLCERPQEGAAWVHARRETLCGAGAGPLAALAAAGSEWAPSSLGPPPRALTALQRRDAPADMHWALQELEAWGTRRGGAWGGARTARAAVRAAAPQAAEGVIGALAVVAAAGAAADEAGAAAAADAALAALEAGGAAGAPALQRLPELVAALPEHATRLVARAFATGAESQLAAESALLRAVATLNALHGC